MAVLASEVAGEDPAVDASEPAPEFLTVDEAAALFRVNHKTIRDAITRGELPGARRIGTAIRIHRDTVLAWFSSGQDRVATSRRK